MPGAEARRAGELQKSCLVNGADATNTAPGPPDLFIPFSATLKFRFTARVLAVILQGRDQRKSQENNILKNV